MIGVKYFERIIIKKTEIQGKREKTKKKRKKNIENWKNPLCATAVAGDATHIAYVHSILAQANHRHLPYLFDRAYITKTIPNTEMLGTTLHETSKNNEC